VVDVKITPEMLIDFNNLILDLKTLMSINMIRVETNGKTPVAKQKLRDLVSFCNLNIKEFNDLFKEPIANNIKYNTEILSKKLNILLKLIHSILSYMGSTLKDYYLDMYEKRFSEVLGHYITFRDKYRIN